MIRRITEKLLLRPDDLKPLRDDFKVIGVFNPGVVKIDNEIVMLARVAEAPAEHRPGFVGLPRRAPDGDMVVDWVPEPDLERADPRVVRCRSDNLLRLTSISHLRVFRSRDEQGMDWTTGPSLLPGSPMEEFGLEDPRITEIDGRFRITCVVVSRFGVATTLISTNDFATFERHGIIFYPENKDVVLFPHKVQGQYVSLHRPNPRAHLSRPQIWVARSPNLLHWGQHRPLNVGGAGWESDRVGAGTPPIALDEGWLEIYHGCQCAQSKGGVGVYSAGALLLDHNDPARILRRSEGPIMQPTADFERVGFVPNVVFPTALIDRGDTLQVYYGAADTSIGVTEFSRDELLAALHRVA